MKKPRVLPMFFYLTCLMALHLLACGDTEATETETIRPLNPSDTLGSTAASTGELEAFILRIESV